MYIKCTSHVYPSIKEFNHSEIQPMELATEPRDTAEHVFRDCSQPSWSKSQGGMVTQV